jgi:hypothetical protein
MDLVTIFVARRERRRNSVGIHLCYTLIGRLWRNTGASLLEVPVDEFFR